MAAVVSIANERGGGVLHIRGAIRIRGGMGWMLGRGRSPGGIELVFGLANRD